MDLWIRSQNKEVLVKCNCLALEEQTKGKYSILNYSGLEFYQFLGTYEYEKALEVLDEINEVKFYKYMASLGWSSFANEVLAKEPMEKQKLILSMMDTYQMPEE